jgi:hypothetical protein
MTNDDRLLMNLMDELRSPYCIITTGTPITQHPEFHQRPPLSLSARDRFRYGGRHWCKSARWQRCKDNLTGGTNAVVRPTLVQQPYRRPCFLLAHHATRAAGPSACPCCSCWELDEAGRRRRNTGCGDSDMCRPAGPIAVATQHAHVGAAGGAARIAKVPAADTIGIKTNSRGNWQYFQYLSAEEA